MIGTLQTEPALGRPDLLAPSVAAALDGIAGASDILVAPIDPALADTAAFCAHYDVPLEVSANCVIVSGKRAGDIRLAACMVLATTRADVNNLVRRDLDVRKASFVPVDTAVAETGMEYGGITPVGLPAGWPILVDAAIVDTPHVIIGSGVRHSKLVLPGRILAALPGARTLDGLGVPTGARAAD